MVSNEELYNILAAIAGPGIIPHQRAIAKLRALIARERQEAAEATATMIDLSLEARVREAMIADGWRQCAQGQRTTQYCAMAERARQEGNKQTNIRDLAICEIKHLVLQEGELYRFTRIEDCKACEDYPNDAEPSIPMRVIKERIMELRRESNEPFVGYDEARDLYSRIVELLLLVEKMKSRG